MVAGTVLTAMKDMLRVTVGGATAGTATVATTVGDSMAGATGTDATSSFFWELAGKALQPTIALARFARAAARAQQRRVLTVVEGGRLAS